MFQTTNQLDVARTCHSWLDFLWYIMVRPGLLTKSPAPFWKNIWQKSLLDIHLTKLNQPF